MVEPHQPVTALMRMIFSRWMNLSKTRTATVMVVVIGLDDPEDAKFFAELQRRLDDTGIAPV